MLSISSFNTVNMYLAEHDMVRASQMPKCTWCVHDINGNPDKSRWNRLRNNSIAPRDESANHKFDYRGLEYVIPSLLDTILRD